MLHHLSTSLAQASHRTVGLRHYTSSTIHLRNHDSNDYSKTIFLPKSKFSGRHNPKIELAVQEDKNFAHTYQEQNPARKPYVVHDGPPFANGQIHLGHAINKILKDIAARYAMITGHRVEFITGWDCHGLPIEMQVLKVLEEQQRQNGYGGNLLLESTTSPEHFRAQARSYAKSQIDLQMASFKRMGLLTDWNKRYTTDDPSYVANQLRAFSHLFEQKLVFKDLMPVNWSLVNKTTIADADIEYRTDHISRSAYVLYEIIDPPFGMTDVAGQPLYSLVWTTTPWTLLENQAIAFNNQETYCVIKAWTNSTEESKNLLVSMDTLHKVESILSRLGFQCELKTYVPGRSLMGLKYKPLLSNLIHQNEEELIDPLPFLDADFVDGSKGTGLVHIAPNYGYDDFSLARKNKLPINPGLVGPTGLFRETISDALAGKHIFTDGVQEILNLLDQHRALLFTELKQHNFPYETRTKQPIIIRASQQIFLNNAIVIPKCLKALKSCSIFPENLRRQFFNTLVSSPNWCISRQRNWGTPIPVLYDAQDLGREKMITHPLIVEHFCKLLYKRRFMDYWWNLGNDELVPQELLDKCKLPYKSDNLVRGMDIFDVWSDSGLSWHTTTNGLDDTKSQADLYLEGVDQIRGWFSASSILSVALRGCLPTRRFFLHGFALDEHGHKMSKSEGNVLDPLELIETYGVDPVRWWAAKVAGANCNICVKPNEFESSIQDAINKIRVTFRYFIGALADHDAIDGKLDHTKLALFDQYFLDKLYRFAASVDQQYKNYRYDQVVHTISRFIAKDISSEYIYTMKDVLYCDELDSERRTSCRIVLNLTYNILLRCLYPLVPHIVQEAGQHMRPIEPLNEWQDLGYKAAWKNEVLHNQFETIINLRNLISEKLGSRRDMLRDQDSILFLDDRRLFKNLSKITNANPDLMAELFRTSTFILSHTDSISPPEDLLETNQNEAHNSEAGSAGAELGDDTIKLIYSWAKESEQELRVGGSISVNNGNQGKFEMCYKKSNNKKCSRCRRYAVFDIQEPANVCDRCRATLHKLEMPD